MKHIHANSLAAYYAGEKDFFSARQQQILAAFSRFGKATDRDICNLLGFPDLNAVRPRITELIKDDVLEEVGVQICVISKKTVRVCQIRASNASAQMELFAKAGRR